MPANLPANLRTILEDLIRSKPSLSCGQLAALFQARTGNHVSRNSVNVARRRLANPNSPSSDHLSGEGLAILERFAREASLDGGASPTDLMHQLQFATGRLVSKWTVQRWLKIWAIPVIRKVATKDLVARVARERRAKLAGASDRP